MPSISIAFGDDILKRFSNQIGELGEGRAKPALARAVNRVTTMARTRVIREVVKQSSIPRRIVVAHVKRRLARVQHSGPLEGVIWATGQPISLKHFKARQLSYGVRAKVQGSWKRYEGAFMGPRPGVIARRLAGNVFVRTSSARLPIEMLTGPSVPEELVRDASARIFDGIVATHLPSRVSHELSRLLP